MSVTDSLYDFDGGDVDGTVAPTEQLPVVATSDTTAPVDDETEDGAVIDGAEQSARSLKPLLVVAVLVAVAFFVGRPLFSNPSTPPGAATLTAGQIRLEVGSVLEATAAAWLDSPETTRSFETVSFPDTWLVVATPTSVYAGVPFGAVCAIGQIDGAVYGTPVYVGIDDTGQACDPVYMSQLLSS